MSDLNRKNTKVLLTTMGIVAGMVVLSFASVPIYRKLCQVTGWGGTTQMVTENPYQPVDGRTITVRFDTGVARNMPWDFKPELREVAVQPGQDGLIAFIAENTSAAPATGTAVYNVTPLKAGKYFFKTQCFCFGEQSLAPGQKEYMPVTFFVDPEIVKDRDMDDVNTITLSYTFFRKDSSELQKALDKYYDDAEKSGAATQIN